MLNVSAMRDMLFYISLSCCHLLTSCVLKQCNFFLFGILILTFANVSHLASISFSLGSSPIFLMALFVMCVACLAGTALVIFKKSRDKPAGYAVLVSGDEE